MRFSRITISWIPLASEPAGWGLTEKREEGERAYPFSSSRFSVTGSLAGFVR